MNAVGLAIQDVGTCMTASRRRRMSESVTESMEGMCRIRVHVPPSLPLSFNLPN